MVDISEMNSLLFKLHSNEYIDFSTEELNQLKQTDCVFDRDLDTVGYSFITKTDYNESDSKRWIGIDHKRIKHIAEKVLNIDYMCKMFEEAADENYVTFPSPLSDNTLKTSTSFTALNTLFLRFYDEGEVFYVSQHYNFVDTLFFPLRNLIISFGDSSGAWNNEIKHFGKMIAYKFADFVTAVNDKNKSFGGIIISDDSPYHYFYNHMFCTEVLHKNNILKKVKNICSIVEEWYYFDLEAVYPDSELRLKTLTNSHIHAISDIAINREFYLNGSLLLKHISVEDRVKSFQRITQAATSLVSEQFNSKIQEVKDCDLVVWMGVTGQKRSWIEQIEGYANIANNLAEKYTKLAVVLDGWTTGKYDEELCLKDENIQKDMAVVGKIIQKLNKNISVVNIVGRSSTEKIAMGSNIDCFIVNNGTGSMYVDAICMKEGVTHTSNKFRLSSNSCHIHNNKYLVPEEQVVDMESDSEFAHVGDYSIDWKDIMVLVNKALLR